MIKMVIALSRFGIAKIVEIFLSFLVKPLFLNCCMEL